MNKLSQTQKIVVIALSVAALLFCTRSVYIVHADACKTTSPGYFVGAIIDKGESIGRSSYRWIIADWKTADGKHLGVKEINAAGMPINRLKIGDTIRTQRVLFIQGYFWFKVAAGMAYTPDTIPIYHFIVAVIFQTIIWFLVIAILIKVFSLLSPYKE